MIDKDVGVFIEEYERDPNDLRVHYIWQEPDPFTVITVCGRIRTREQATGVRTCLECIAEWEMYLRTIAEHRT